MPSFYKLYRKLHKRLIQLDNTMRDVSKYKYDAPYRKYICRRSNSFLRNNLDIQSAVYFLQSNKVGLYANNS